VREVAREVAAESLTDLPPSVGLPKGKVLRHLGTMGLNTLARKRHDLPIGPAVNLGCNESCE
jgi:hypothetical protein